MFDVYTAIAFGFAGYFMVKFKLSAAALILGLILGGMAESGLLLSLVMSRGDVFGYYTGRPICLILIALIILSVATPLVSHMRAKKK